MAEAAGLALSGIALVGLFSTCLEISEYLEQFLDWSEDFQLALTKISLMKKRLSHWGTAMSIAGSGEEAEILRERWPAESEVIMDSLLSIRNILDKTTCVCWRHSCSSAGQDHANTLRSRLNNEGCNGLSTSVSYPAFLPSHPTGRPVRAHKHGTLTTVHSKIVWVFRDRKRLQELITDFDFLLDNLEKISERLQKERTTTTLPWAENSLG